MKMKQEIIIRQMEPKDFSEVAELENSLWTANETPATIQSSPERYIENIQNGVRYLLAVEETSDEIFGVLVLSDRHKVEPGKHVLTFSPLVTPAARHQGIGTFLVEFAKEYALKEGYKKISIEVISTDTAALALYRKCGFIQEGLQKREFFLNGQWVDDYYYSYFVPEGEK
ncbi:MAG: GNAT family N-acetyltransferase [Streptococcaceae bacterium]|jgi:RimJ/RimL family protein N-acetyltransferase|nr:GNAT family N-acetyltransferase [Streptococcaceae bacterium]